MFLTDGKLFLLIYRFYLQGTLNPGRSHNIYNAVQFKIAELSYNTVFS